MMKFAGWFSLVCLAAPSAVAAQEPGSRSMEDIAGLYQLCTPRGTAADRVQPVPVPCWKIYNSDGSFYTFRWPATPEAEPTMTSAGTCTVERGGVLAERISGNCMLAFMEGRTNRMKYVRRNDLLEICFGEADSQEAETWKRLDRPDGYRPGADAGSPGSARRVRPLVGIWQLCGVAPDGARGDSGYFPYWKVFRVDGTFAVFAWKARDRVAEITVEGTYRVGSKDVYTESVVATTTDPALAGRKNRLEYRFAGDDMLEVRYRLPGQSAGVTERWKRVVAPVRTAVRP